jgi:hypothetical protein
MAARLMHELTLVPNVHLEPVILHSPQPIFDSGSSPRSVRSDYPEPVFRSGSNNHILKRPRTLYYRTIFGTGGCCRIQRNKSNRNKMMKAKSSTVLSLKLAGVAGFQICPLPTQGDGCYKCPSGVQFLLEAVVYRHHLRNILDPVSFKGRLRPTTFGASDNSSPALNVLKMGEKS